MSTIDMTGVQMSLKIHPDDVKRILDERGMLDTYEAGFSAPYAAEVEYGTGPGTVTPYAELDEWARRKVGITDEEERATFVHAVIRDHYRRGKRPQPFFQPALREVAMNIKDYKDEFANEGIYVIAQAVISTAQDNIEREGIADTGHLGQSSYVRRERI